MTQDGNSRRPHRLSVAGPSQSAAGMVATAEDVAASALAAEDAGYDYFGYGDTVWRDVYSVLSLVAWNTRRVSLGTSATNPLTRHPMATASAIATVDEISGGRAYLGIGMGQSANAIAGLPQATADELRRSIVVISSAHRRSREFEPWPGGVQVDESVVELQWVKRRVPILVAAGFSKGLRVAAEMADGVMLRAGDVDWSGLQARIEQLRRWRAEGPRAGEPFEIQMLYFSYLTDEIEAGRKALGGLVSSRANTSTRESQLPAELVKPFRAYKDGYDYAHHASSVNPVNQELMVRLGLDDYFFERYSFIGSEEDLVDKLIEMQEVGVTATTIGGPPERAQSAFQKYKDRCGQDAVTSGILSGKP